MRTFDDIFEVVIRDIPERIDLSGAGVPGPEATGHFFPQLTSAEREADSRHADGSFESLMVWSIFGVLHKHAMSLSRVGILELRPSEVPTDEFEARYWADLHTEDWPSLLDQYERTAR